jgi:hypothetical protein
LSDAHMSLSQSPSLWLPLLLLRHDLTNVCVRAVLLGCGARDVARDARAVSVSGVRARVRVPREVDARHLPRAVAAPRPRRQVVRTAQASRQSGECASCRRRHCCHGCVHLPGHRVFTPHLYALPLLWGCVLSSLIDVCRCAVLCFLCRLLTSRTLQRTSTHTRTASCRFRIAAQATGAVAAGVVVPPRSVEAPPLVPPSSITEACEIECLYTAHSESYKQYQAEYCTILDVGTIHMRWIRRECSLGLRQLLAVAEAKPPRRFLRVGLALTTAPRRLSLTAGTCHTGRGASVGTVTRASHCGGGSEVAVLVCLVVVPRSTGSTSSPATSDLAGQRTGRRSQEDVQQPRSHRGVCCGAGSGSGEVLQRQVHRGTEYTRITSEASAQLLHDACQ